MKISLFMSSVRLEKWHRLLTSLKSNTIKYEVIGAGFIEPDIVSEIAGDFPEFKYIKTENIKVAQCYEVARRACRGELVGWISDDCEFSPQALDKIYDFYKQNCKWNDIIAIKNYDPECENNNLNDQRFFSRNLNTPQMANFGFISRDYLNKFGGFDRRYAYGKFECDLCMRTLAYGGRVVKFEDAEVKVNHSNKMGHLNNDWSGVNEDSEQLEKSWVIGGYQGLPEGSVLIKKGIPEMVYPITNAEVTLVRTDEFEGYTDQDLLTKSQGLVMLDRWV